MSGEVAIAEAVGGLAARGGARLLARGALAALGPVGWVAIGALTLYDAYAVYNAIAGSDDDADKKPECETGDCDKPAEKIDKKPPFKGEPNSTVQGPDNSRTYGSDGYPLTDRDAGHQNESGIGAGDHVHDWGRPANGDPPTNADRGISRLPQPGDPPVPWRNTPSS
jgi:hypothetical protein